MLKRWSTHAGLDLNKLEHGDLRELVDLLRDHKDTLLGQALKAYFAGLDHRECQTLDGAVPHDIAKVPVSELFAACGARWGLERATMGFEELLADVEQRLARERKETTR